MNLNIVMADSCWKSFFKTSISRNHAYRVLHSRFPPFGFVLKPFWSIYMFLNMIMAFLVELAFLGVGWVSEENESRRRMSPDDTCIPRKTCIPRNTCILGIHVSLGKESIGGLWQVWEVQNSNVNSNNHFFDSLTLARSVTWKKWFYLSKSQL